MKLCRIRVNIGTFQCNNIPTAVNVPLMLSGEFMFTNYESSAFSFSSLMG